MPDVSDSDDDEDLEHFFNSFVGANKATSVASSRNSSRLGYNGRQSVTPTPFGRDTPGPRFDESDNFRRQVNRGLAYIDEAAKEAHRRNADLSRCLEEVQADITRISDRMTAARQERIRGRAATQAAASKIFANATPSMPSAAQPPKATASARPFQNIHASYASRKYSAAPPRSPRSSDRPGSRAMPGIGARRASGRGRAPSTRTSEAPSARCSRAAQEGFSFGSAGTARRKLASEEAAPQQEDDNPHRATKDNVRAQMASMRHKSEAEQKAFVKQLLVKWHPDRNPDSTEMATAMFQYIQQEKEHLLGL